MRSPRLASRHSIASVTLLERGLDLEAIDRAAVAAAEGRGAVVVIEGAAGIGKSALLRHAVSAERLHTLRARGGEQERVLPSASRASSSSASCPTEVPFSRATNSW